MISRSSCAKYHKIIYDVKPRYYCWTSSVETVFGSNIQARVYEYREPLIIFYFILTNSPHSRPEGVSTFFPFQMTISISDGSSYPQPTLLKLKHGLNYFTGEQASVKSFSSF